MSPLNGSKPELGRLILGVEMLANKGETLAAKIPGGKQFQWRNGLWRNCRGKKAGFAYLDVLSGVCENSKLSLKVSLCCYGETDSHEVLHRFAYIQNSRILQYSMEVVTLCST